MRKVRSWDSLGVKIISMVQHKVGNVLVQTAKADQQQTPSGAFSAVNAEATQTYVERLVHSIAEVLVHRKELIHVDSRQDQHGTTLVLKVAPEDLPTFLENQGRTVESMRTLVQSVGKKRECRLSLYVTAHEESAVR
jgi:predicted RNA-binding protein YlqC (UPF0109 family)